MMKDQYSVTYSDTQGNVYDFPGPKPVFRSGRKFVEVTDSDLIPLPYGSFLFSLPERFPVYSQDNTFLSLTDTEDFSEVWAVSSFLSSGFLRTYLPAYRSQKNARPLSLWAYCGVVFKDDEFYVPAIRIDDDPRSDPELHENEQELKVAIKSLVADKPDNRLVNQLSYCAQDYRCLCARNFFLSRYEAPVPTTVACNARCIGCLSHQNDSSGFKQSQNRLTFEPTTDEIADVILHHINKVEQSVVSFGQGCEGEPLLRAKDLSEAVRRVRSATGAGTININTNGSLPEHVRLMVESGIDSIRFSLNSPSEKYYNRYYRPVGYTLENVKESIGIAMDAGVFVSLNLFFLPGFTDSSSEVDELCSFLEKYPVNMIQTRNLNIDPDIYLDQLEFRETPAIGIVNLLGLLKKKFPEIRLGYYNPPKETY